MTGDPENAGTRSPGMATMQQNLTNFLPLLVLFGIAILVWLLVKKPRTKPTTDATLAALCRYFDNVNATRAFPSVKLDVVTAKKGEFGLINEQANLYELRAHRQSVGVSFRVAKGVYVGKRAYVAKDHLDRTAVGTVILTNQRLLFVGAKTITIQISNIIAAQAGGDHLQIHSEKRQRPVVLRFPSAQLAALLIAAFLRHPLAENTLPKDMTITATPTANRDGITLSFRDSNEPQQLVATR
jgi:hypothetical protein